MLTAVPPSGRTVRQAYKREITTALTLGVPEHHIAVVVNAFRGEQPDPDVFRVALAQYVPALALMDDSDDDYRPKGCPDCGGHKVTSCRRTECPNGGRWPA